MSSNGHITVISGSALAWVLGFGKGNALAADVTSEQLTLGWEAGMGGGFVHFGGDSGI